MTHDPGGLSGEAAVDGPLPVAPVGSQGLAVARVGLGCMGMSQWYGSRDDASSRETIQRALELGVCLLDTSDAYGPFTNEIFLGDTLGSDRPRAVLATKVGIKMAPDGTRLGIDGSPGHIASALTASLRRLNTDWVDLLYLHRVDASVPIEESIGAMGDLVGAGKVRYIGLCEVNQAVLERANATFPITALQSEYSPWSREPEDDILPTTLRLGVGFVSYSPLGRGLLTGKIRSADDLAPDDERLKRFPRFSAGNIEANLAVVDKLAALAAARQVTTAQLLLAWALCKWPHLMVLPGTKHRRYLEENVASLPLRLSTDDIQAIEAVVEHSPVKGPRKDEVGMQRMQAGLQAGYV